MSLIHKFFTAKLAGSLERQFQMKLVFLSLEISDRNFRSFSVNIATKDPKDLSQSTGMISFLCLHGQGSDFLELGKIFLSCFSFVSYCQCFQTRPALIVLPIQCIEYRKPHEILTSVLCPETINFKPLPSISLFARLYVQKLQKYSALLHLRRCNEHSD